MVSYWALRAWMPIAAFVVYVALWEYPRVAKIMSRGLRVALVAALGLLVYGMLTRFTLSAVVGSPLSYESAIEACLFAFLTLSLVEGEHGVAYAALGVSAVGILYEWPLSFEPRMVFNPVTLSSPLGLNVQFLSVGMLLLLCRRRLGRPAFLVMATVYVASCIYLLSTAPQYYPTLMSVHRWIVRLPSYALVSSLVWVAPKWGDRLIFTLKDRLSSVVAQHDAPS